MLGVSTSENQPRRIEVPNPPRLWWRYRTIDGKTYDVLAMADDYRTWNYVEAQLRAWGVESTVTAVGPLDAPAPLPPEVPGSLTIDDHLETKDPET